MSRRSSGFISKSQWRNEDGLPPHPNEITHQALMSIFNHLESFSIFVYSPILLPCALQGLSIYLSLPILSERNAVVAIIKAGLTAASESGDQKGNKTSEIRGHHQVPRSNSTL